MGFASSVDAVVRREPERDLSGCHAATWILAADGEPRSASLWLNWAEAEGNYTHVVKLWVMLRLGDGWMGVMRDR